MLRAAIANQRILGTITIRLSTTGVGSGIENIPFLGIANPAQANNPTGPANAFVSSATATFWIEWVGIPGAVAPAGPAAGPGQTLLQIEPFWPQVTFLQLQYSQVVILVFDGVLWPHLTMATLQLSHG